MFAIDFELCLRLMKITLATNRNVAPSPLATIRDIHLIASFELFDLDLRRTLHVDFVDKKNQGISQRKRSFPRVYPCCVVQICSRLIIMRSVAISSHKYTYTHSYTTRSYLLSCRVHSALHGKTFSREVCTPRR